MTAVIGRRTVAILFGRLAGLEQKRIWGAAYQARCPVVMAHGRATVRRGTIHKGRGCVMYVTSSGRKHAACMHMIIFSKGRAKRCETTTVFVLR